MASYSFARNPKTKYNTPIIITTAGIAQKRYSKTNVRIITPIHLRTNILASCGPTIRTVKIAAKMKSIVSPYRTKTSISPQ